MGEKRASGAWVRTAVLGVVIAGAMVLGGVLAVTVGGGRSAGPEPVAGAFGERSTLPVVGVATAPASAARVGAAIDNLPDLVDRVRASVVSVNTVVNNRAGNPQGEGLGTGVVVDRQGHILTNHHVVEGASTVTVKFADGTVLGGKVIGSDPGNDLAVVKVSAPAEAFTPARFANSDAVRVGQSVFAVGNPFALEFTVTAGIVSGVERQSGGGISGRPVRGVIQTDAAVNPGNSGGPLFDAEGNVIGINASIENPTGQRVFVGVGFAIPANTAVRFLPDMIAGKAITHPQLGVAGVTLNAINAKEAGVEPTKGVYITAVSAGSAVDRAGLRGAANFTASGALPPGGDVVTAINGNAVTTMEQLARAIDGFNVGDTVRLGVVRGGRTLGLSATLQEWTGR